MALCDAMVGLVFTNQAAQTLYGYSNEELQAAPSSTVRASR